MSKPLEGWDAIDALTRAKPVSAEDAPAELIDKLHSDVFANPLGRKWLAWAVGTYLDAPVCEPGGGADHGFYREGQNAVIRDIIRRVQRSQKVRL
jgi:hypothetical protein